MPRCGIGETVEGAGIDIARGPEGLVLTGTGAWTVANAAALDARLREALRGPAAAARFALGGLSRLDTAGAFLIVRTVAALREAGSDVSVEGLSAEHELLVEQVAGAVHPPEPPSREPRGIARLVLDIGAGTLGIWQELLRLLAFTGLVVETFGRTAIKPTRLRVVSLVHHMETTGLNAVPIIFLITFLIGAVVTYLGSDILSTFGAEVYTINLLSFAVLREFGILLAAIMVAGRSGSAFTAQIGSMRAREEIDAMRTLGLDPIELLVVPRVLALVLVLPMLTVLADLSALLGGLLVSWTTLDITPWLFTSRLIEATQLQHFWVGLIKAPFFAFVVATVGCFQGLLVEGTAESVGRRTTLSVVEAIFLVIVLDAFFAIFFIQIHM